MAEHAEKAASKNGSPSPQGGDSLAVSRWIARFYVGEPIIGVNSPSLEGAEQMPKNGSPSTQGGITLAVSRWIARLYVGEPIGMVNSISLEGAEQTPKNGSPSTQGMHTLAVSRWIARFYVGDATLMHSTSLEGAAGVGHAATGNNPSTQEEEVVLHAKKGTPTPLSTVPETFLYPSPTSGPTPISSSPAPSSCDGPRPPIAATPCLFSKSTK